MQKKFITNLILVLVLNVIVKPFYILGIDAEVLRQTGEDYGVYFSLLGLTFILNIFLDAGIVNYNTKNIAQHKQLLHKHFSGIISIRIVLSFIYFILIYITAWLLNYPKAYYWLLTVLAFNQVLVAFILYFRSNLSGLLLFKKDSLISVLDRILLIGILSYLLWFRNSTVPFNIEWFAYAQTAAYFITLVVAFIFVLKQTGKIRFKLNKLFSFAIVRQSLPYATLILLMMLYYRSDAIMLERLLPNGKEETTLYAQGYRFFEAFNMLGFLFAGLLLPLFSRLIKLKEDLNDLLFSAFKLLFSTAVIIALAAFLTKTEIIEWRYQLSGNELINSVNSFGILLFCFIAISTTYIFGTLLTANGNLKLLNWLAFGGVVLNVILNLYLIPIYGAFGAAIASLITQTITVLGQITISFMLLDIEINKSTLTPTISFIFLISIIYFSFYNYINIPWYSQFISFGVIGLIVAFVTKMIDLKSLIQLLKKD